jgi:bifunctional DNase/RNase
MRCQECQAAAVLHVTDACGRSVVGEWHLCEEHCRRFLDAHPIPPQDVHRRPALSEGIVAAQAVEGLAAQPPQPRAAAGEAEVDIGRVIISEIHEQQVVFLREVGGNRTLPMMCGIFEATSIDRTLKGLAVPRPLTHDAWIATVAALGGEVQGVQIHDLREQTYFAEVRIRQAGRLVVVDVRPSDAFVLALKCGVPILVAERVLAEAGGQPGEHQITSDATRQKSQPAAVAPAHPPGHHGRRGSRWSSRLGTFVVILVLLAIILVSLFSVYCLVRRGY